MNRFWAWLARNMPDVYLAVMDVYLQFHGISLRYPKDDHDQPRTPNHSPSA